MSKKTKISKPHLNTIIGRANTMDLKEAIWNIIEPRMWDNSEWRKPGEYDYRNIVTVEELINLFPDSDEDEVRWYYNGFWDEFNDLRENMGLFVMADYRNTFLL